MDENEYELQRLQGYKNFDSGLEEEALNKTPKSSLEKKKLSQIDEDNLKVLKSKTPKSSLGKIENQIECDIIVTNEALKAAGQAIENFNKNEINKIGTMTYYVLKDMVNEKKELTPASLCGQMFLTKTNAILSDSKDVEKYNSIDYQIMRDIFPSFHNVETKHSGNMSSESYFTNKKNITLIMFNGILKQNGRDGQTFTEEEYKEEIKRRLEPILQHLIRKFKDKKNIKIETIVPGAGVWAELGEIKGASDKKKIINELFCQGWSELLDKYKSDKIQVTVHCMPLVSLKEKNPNLTIVDNFDMIKESNDDKENHIVQMIAGDPLAIPGSDVFLFGKEGETNEKLIMNTNIPREVYDIDMSNVEQPVGNEEDRKLIADHCAKLYEEKIEPEPFYKKNFYKCRLSVIEPNGTVFVVQRKKIKLPFLALEPNAKELYPIDYEQEEAIDKTNNSCCCITY